MTNDPSNFLPVPPPSRLTRTGKRTVLIGALLTLIIMLGAIHNPAFGQAIPAAEAAPISTGFDLPRTSGTLQYSIGASENISDGYYGNSGIFASTGVNGNLAYISPSQTSPFSMVFSGGDQFANSGQPSTLFLNLGLSQVFNLGRWNFLLSDSVSYLPQTPSTGISGIPGTGDLGIPPVVVGPDTGQGLLTPNSTRVGNAVSLNVTRSLTGKTSIQANGDYSILRFVGNSTNVGLQSDSASGTIGLTHRLDARTTLTGNYTYSKFTYDTGEPGFISQTASAGFTRQLSRKMAMSASAGPQWTNGSGNTSNTATSINLYASAALSYAAQFTSYSLAYSRGVNSGSGVILGALSDSVSFRASRTFARVWNGAFTSSYTHTTGLAATGGSSSFVPETYVDAVQVSRALARSLSAYASYTLEDQSIQHSSTAVDAFSGFFQVVAFGVTYSPTSIHFGPR